jgi:hypothetical protein
MTRDELYQLARKYQASHFSELYQAIYKYADYGWWEGKLDEGQMTWKRWYGTEPPMSAEVV